MMIRDTDGDAAASVIRAAFCIGVTGAFLAACGASSLPRASNGAISVPSALKNNKIFDYTGKQQTFVVPAGVTRLSVIARGAWGAGNTSSAAYPGRVYALVRVHPGDKLHVFVGGAGLQETGGFNGGGSGGGDGSGGGAGYGGGGASDVRIGGDALKDRIVVAAGGGGAGNGMEVYLFDSGGDGGGTVGDPGVGGATSRKRGLGGDGGGGGTQSQGGSGGTGGQGSSGNGDAGKNGALGSGGNGGTGESKTSYAYGGGGGGGGGGYYGGGGGGGAGLENTPDYFYCGSCNGGGGGGGSSYVEPSAVKSQMWTGWRQSGNGRVIFSWD